ncbi:MAG TPA: DUF308 domain-containing protein [bacterium]|nr:DUF308 domain-containing protein [bacterium]
MRHHIMAKFWWILSGRGVLGILFGAGSLFWAVRLEEGPNDLFGLSIFLRPVSILATLLLMLGCYAFLDGLFSLVLGAQDFGGGKRWNSLLVEGSLSIALGIWTWIQPEKGALVLFYWIASWSLLTGALEIHQSLDLTEYRDRKRSLLMAGAVSMLYGTSIFLFHPSGIRLVVLTGLFALLFGIPLLVLGLRLRRFTHGKYQPGAHRPVPER